MSEKEFLAVWEKNHVRPEKKEDLPKWEHMRALALAYWRIEQEAEQKEREKKKEKEAFQERVKRHINYHMLEEQYDRNIVQEMCFLPGIEPYTGNTFDNSPVLPGMSGITALACIMDFDMLDTLANHISDAVLDDKPAQTCDQIWKGLLEPKKDSFVKLRRLSQCGKHEEMADLVHNAMQGIVKAALTPDWNYNRLLRFVGDEMVQTFYQMDDTTDPELKHFKETFHKKDKDQILQKFQALKRMTELMALYHKSVEKLKNPAMEQERFSKKELRDFLVGSYVSKELKKSYETGELTAKALQFGKIDIEKTSGGGNIIVYGDEALYQEMLHSKSYEQISQKSIGEIKKMLKKEVQEAKKEEFSYVDTKRIKRKCKGSIKG